MKTKKLTKFFDFTLLQENQEYDRDTEKLLSHLTNIHPEITAVINFYKSANMPAYDKIALLHAQFVYAYCGDFEEDELSYLSQRIGTYLFDGSEEYKYRKQFTK